MCSNVGATSACSPKDIYIDSPGPKEQGSWLRKVRQSGEYSNVSIVVENQTFHLHMLPLLQESLHLKEVFSSRGVSKDPPPGHHGSEMAIELPNFPGGAAIFAKVMDFCYSIEVRFTTSNVAALMAASKYLRMDNLTKKAEEFLERSVYKNWRNCLVLWTTIDHKSTEFVNGRLNEVTKKCERGFLDCIVTRNEASSNGHGQQQQQQQLWCNIRDVREMVALSSPTLASRVFQTLVESSVGLFYAAAEPSDTTAAAAAASSILLYQPSPLPPPFPDSNLAPPTAAPPSSRWNSDRGQTAATTIAWKSVSERNAGEAIVWLKGLPLALTAEWQRIMFYRYIGEWMMQGTESGEAAAAPPLVLEGFFLSLLMEATKMVSKPPTKHFPNELMSVISRLKTFRGIWLMRVVDLKWLAHTVSRSELDHSSFEILHAIAKRIREVHGSQQEQEQQPSHSSSFFMQTKAGSNSMFKENLQRIDKLIKAGNPLLYAEKAVANFEESLIFQMKKKSLSVEQVLALVHEFPSSLRSSHESLYKTLEQVSRVRPLTAAELHDVNRILDYRMVSDEVVKSAFRHPRLGFSHSLLNRAMELEITKLDRVRLHYDQDDNCLSSREQLLRSRKCHLILEKALRTHMRASMLLSERYRSLEEKVDALSRSPP